MRRILHQANACVNATRRLNFDGRHVSLRSNRDDRTAVSCPRGDFRSVGVGSAGVQNVHGDVFLHRRRQRRGMQNLRPKLRQFRRLVEIHLADDASVGAELWVGRHDAINVSPYLDASCTERGSDYGSSEIRSSAAESRGNAASVAAM